MSSPSPKTGSYVANHLHFQEAQMARNNNQESETARAGVREATDRAEDVVQTGIQAARRVAEEFGRVLGVGGQNENLTRQATQNLEAITETGSVLIRGFQDVSREWLDLMQERLRKNAEGMTKLAQCRTLPDFAAVQSDLARDNLNQIIDLTRRVAEKSMQVAEEAAKTITAETGKSAGRFPRAA
jgi:hypothetical protein